MSISPEIEATNILPTRLGAAVFRAKTLMLQTRRFIRDTTRDVGASQRGDKLADQPVIAESKTALWTETSSEERHLVAGKIQNLRLAVAALDGLELTAGETFSFWANVGRTSRRRGFVAGRELREGCIIPNVGGGLCQISNALYDAALRANFEIVERHAHTQVIAGSLAEHGRDATVFWNYVDLRFRSPKPFRIEAKLTGDHLEVHFLGEKADEQQLHRITRGSQPASELGSCASCGMDDCFRVIKPPQTEFGRTAFLVDEYVPEFDAYIRSKLKPHDELFLPIDGKRFKRANYGWSTDGFEEVHQSRYLTVVRSYRSRKLAAQGAARQRNLLAMSERLAESYARRLDFEALHVVVQQDLLPYLWNTGRLGGRTFDVLMTALPMTEIQSRLDAAHDSHPESRTLADFRADTSLVAAESEALRHARKIVTAHTAVADLFSEKTDLLPWRMPAVEACKASHASGKPVIVFPASTVGRKGCYEFRDSLRDLDITLLTMGPLIEDADFWKGFDTRPAGDNWLEQASLVVLPAFVEHRPRRLLQAAAAGIPVIASDACGVRGVSGITSFTLGDASALSALIQDSLFPPKPTQAT
ncbi:MAG TPA: VanW family protein [Pyrinomonadaceae bacterium]|jgi:hypothetical protein|nr:VanW family protein [Pyrinomonadaceae bacterium]